MTAEVCVMNSLGVALAADSAVTFTGPGEPKIYQSADKLFLLSEVDPVGVMVWGSASLLGVPWETIIKRYRAVAGSRRHGTVKEHAKAFLAFLEGDRTTFPHVRQQAVLAADTRAMLSELLENAEAALALHLKPNVPIRESDVSATLDRVISERLS